MIECLKKGDVYTFEQVYTQYHNKVYAYFKKKAASPEDASDLLQVTFLKLWQYRQSLSSDYLLEQHLFHIVKTVFVDYLRRQSKYMRIQKAVFHQKEKDCPISNALLYDTTSEISVALNAMPELHRKVFELNRLQGYSYKEVANLLSISVKAVDNNLTKALKQLRKQVAVVSLLLFILTHF